LRAVSEANDDDANIVVAVFMEFIGQQATLLDFEQRVEMSASIVGCCRKMRLCASRVVVDALAHVTLYFAQFLPLVRDHCSRVREPIENELKELLKLGKWDTYDYNMLKDTIEKSHRQLHRLSVKLITDLRSPLSEFLASSFKSHAANPTPALKTLQPRDVDAAAQSVYCTAEPAVFCSHLAACSSGDIANAHATAPVSKSKRNRNSLDIGYDKKSLHQVCSFKSIDPMLFAF
jgi:midasin (ATPase involved in ribosome maturation)